MAYEEPAGEEPTIGKLVVDAFDDIGTLIRHIVELAKSELKVSVRAGGMAIALFVLAGFIGLLSIIMVSFAIAYFIAMAGLDIADPPARILAANRILQRLRLVLHLD